MGNGKGKSMSRRGDVYAAAANRLASEPRGQAAMTRDMTIEFEQNRRTQGLETADQLLQARRMAQDPNVATAAKKVKR